MHVVAIRFNALGDVVLTLPALAHLRASHGGPLHLTFVTRRAWAGLLRFSPLIDTVITLSSRISMRTLACSLRLDAPDVVFDFHNNLRSHLLTAALPGVPVVRTPSTHLSRRRMVRGRHGAAAGPRASIPPVVMQHRATVDRYLATRCLPIGRGAPPGSDPVFPTYQAGGAQRPPLPLLTPSDGARRWVAGRIPASARSVALMPGARHPNKRWPARRFRALAARLTERGVTPCVLGGPGEMDRMRFVAEGSASSVLVPLKWDLMLAVLERAGGAVGNDSGLSHVAEALGIPVITLFGPTVPEFGFSPTHAHAAVVQRDLACRPCSLHGGPGCATEFHACLEDISTEEVFAAVQTRLLV